MKPMVTLVFWLLSCAALAEPILSEAMAERILQQNVERPLYWNPFPLPYEVAQNDNGRDAVLLNALYRHGLVEREEVKTQIKGALGRPQYHLKWLYRYLPERLETQPEGFYYGNAKLVKLESLSSTSQVKGEYFVQGKILWGVDRQQSWVADADFNIARTLRRSLDSIQRPFEREVVFRYHPKGLYWYVWEPEPKFFE